MPAYPPFAVPQSYATQLGPADELAFRQWVQQNNVPFNLSAAGPTDYDMRGYWRGLTSGQPMARPSEVNPNDNRPHFTDYYKTPMHQTFSSESQWAGPTAPQWLGNSLFAPSGRLLFDERPQPSLLGSVLGR